MIAIVDSGPLFAAVDVRDPHHRTCLDILERLDLELVIPAMVVAEVSYFISERINGAVEAEFLRGLDQFDVESPIRADWPLIANLVERYSDFPLSGTDASVAVLAERLGTDLIITLDPRHFSAITTSDGRPFNQLPEAKRCKSSASAQVCAPLRALGFPA